MEHMSDSRRQQAEAILRKHERLAADQSELNPGVHEVMSWLRKECKKIGLVTRNQRDSVETICRRHNLSFDGVVTREDGPPYKPDPFPVQSVCEKMDVQPDDSVMVGDYLFDLLSGKRAGAKSVLLGTNKTYPDYANEADYVILNLTELPDIIDEMENGKNRSLYKNNR
jgi:HAD superfamily hydrolase (TIGR01549 family)